MTEKLKPDKLQKSIITIGNFIYSIVMFIPSILFDLDNKFIDRFINQNPKRAKIFSALLMILYIVAVIMLFTFTTSNKKVETPSLKEQIEQLNTVESSLDNLQDFITNQKSKLEETEKTVTQLNKEKENLEAIVNLNKKSIDAIFSLQEERNKKEVWKERLIGFALGIISSIVASTVINVFQRMNRKNRQAIKASNT